MVKVIPELDHPEKEWKIIIDAGIPKETFDKEYTQKEAVEIVVKLAKLKISSKLTKIEIA